MTHTYEAISCCCFHFWFYHWVQSKRHNLTSLKNIYMKMCVVLNEDHSNVHVSQRSQIQFGESYCLHEFSLSNNYTVFVENHKLWRFDCSQCSRWVHSFIRNALVFGSSGTQAVYKCMLFFAALRRHSVRVNGEMLINPRKLFRCSDCRHIIYINVQINWWKGKPSWSITCSEK